jgi:integrase
VFALPKNDKERVVPLPEWVMRMVELHTDSFGPRPYTLPWEKITGKPHRNFDETVWKPALAMAGVIPQPTLDARKRKKYVTDRKTGVHSLRHYYASVTWGDGVNIRELAEYLGRSDPGFTLRIYNHMLPHSHERARKAIDRRMLRRRLIASSNGAETEQRNQAR